MSRPSTPENANIVHGRPFEGTPISPGFSRARRLGSFGSDDRGGQPETPAFRPGGSYFGHPERDIPSRASTVSPLLSSRGSTPVFGHSSPRRPGTAHEEAFIGNPQPGDSDLNHPGTSSESGRMSGAPIEFSLPPGQRPESGAQPTGFGAPPASHGVPLQNPGFQAMPPSHGPQPPFPGVGGPHGYPQQQYPSGFSRMNPMNQTPWSQPLQPQPPMYNQPGGYPGYPQQSRWTNVVSTVSNWVGQFGQMGMTIISTGLSLLTGYLNLQKEAGKDIEELSKHST
ncbi:hypothetical protein PQR05_08965 [Paraburkholderia sediminicola]|uniref:hypothetical protein n=1 Tax=Paraburkholderia sediminicola TaxID=458836 RepID=UPI0038BB3A20